ncbi:XRE family transcriptional regulator [Coprobacillus sp. AF17-11AC]|nr:XRE family transcriptional regulator [Coprobacillus sp. AF17-17AC]RGG83210.1 XRE family transcriptional regulator [Coprobacillus sp. AF17-11AC]
MQQIGDRIYSLRKKLGLSQGDFGSKIGIKKASMSAIENNRSNPSEQTIMLICKEFNVNYAWLKEGLGDMTSEYSDVLLRRLTDEYDLDDLDRKIVENYLRLSKEKREVIKEYLQNIFIDKKDD